MEGEIIGKQPNKYEALLFNSFVFTVKLLSRTFQPKWNYVDEYVTLRLIVEPIVTDHLMFANVTSQINMNV